MHIAYFHSKVYKLTLDDSTLLLEAFICLFGFFILRGWYPQALRCLFLC